MSIVHQKPNTLRILGADGITVRVTYYNVEDYKILDKNFISFKIGKNTTCSKYPTEKPVEAGDTNAHSDSLIIGREYKVSGICEYFEDPLPVHHIHQHKLNDFKGF